MVGGVRPANRGTAPEVNASRTRFSVRREDNRLVKTLTYGNTNSARDAVSHPLAGDGGSRRSTVSSARAVMNTIGISCWRRANSRWRSGPDMPGIAMSRIRHLVWSTYSDARN
jgi:hypothetical protein